MSRRPPWLWRANLQINRLAPEIREMSCIRPRGLVAVALAAVCLSGPSNAAQKPRSGAATSHDGVYAVEIVTQRGSCDRVYRWTISVAGGRISTPADALMQANGQINPRGIVSLSFRRDAQVATVSGRVEGRSGSGTWSPPTLQCAGSWRAARQ
jgi:hypothetical protein